MSFAADAAIGASGFVRAVTLRVGPGKLLVASLAMVALVYFGAMGISAQIWLAPGSAKLARAVEVAVLGVLLVLAIVAADEAVDRGAPRAITYTVAIVGAAVLGALLGWEVRAALGFDFVPPGGKFVLPAVHPFFHRLDLALVGTLLGGLVAFVHVNRRTALAARRRQHEAEQARARAGRRTLESQLQALQARVEPMFLFGTLQRIRQLYRSDAAAAGAMLEDLIVYLRAALPHLRESSSTVEKEMALAGAWLDIVGRSATDRRVDFDIVEAARQAHLPALVMLPLVQQAVGGTGHGPLALRVQAQVVGDRLRIEISTSTDAFSGGIAGRPLLEQIDARLRAIYGEATRVECRRLGDAGGSHAGIELPLEGGVDPQVDERPPERTLS